MPRLMKTEEIEKAAKEYAIDKYGHRLQESEICFQRGAEFILDRSVEVTKKESAGKDEYYGEWYNCPACGSSMVIVGSNYCLECGIKLDWKL